MVEEGVYRSAYPTEANVQFLRHVGIRHIVLLSAEPLRGPVRKLLAADVAGRTASECVTRGPIRVLHSANMESWRLDDMNSGDDFSQTDMMRALDFAVDQQWHPVLFACPLGELQTSVLVGCMRRYQFWSLAAIYGECDLFTRVCRTLRPSIMSFIDAWDPALYPISATNILYRNQEMQERDQSQKKEKTRFRGHRGSTSEAAERSALSGSEEVDEEASEDSEPPERGPFSSASSPQRTRSEASDTQTPNHADRKTVNSEANLISTSGQRPPIALRRAAAAAQQRLREIQLQRKADDDGQASIQWAPWYLQTLAVSRLLNSSAVDGGSPLQENGRFGAALPLPHVRYAAVRNPPALDERSTFTKESIVEEDDD